MWTRESRARIGRNGLAPDQMLALIILWDARGKTGQNFKDQGWWYKVGLELAIQVR